MNFSITLKFQKPRAKKSTRPQILTSAEAIAMMEAKEKQKREEQEIKELWKKEREEKQQQRVQENIQKAKENLKREAE